MPEVAGFNISIQDTKSKQIVPERFVNESYDDKTDTRYVVCFIEVEKGQQFSIMITNKSSSRMGIIVHLDNMEQNRVGIRPGYMVNLSGKPIASDQEEVFTFGKSEDPQLIPGNVRLELYRSSVTHTMNGYVGYASTNRKKSIPIAPIRQMSQVRYLDSNPKVICCFEYRTREGLDQLLTNPQRKIEIETSSLDMQNRRRNAFSTKKNNQTKARRLLDQIANDPVSAACLLLVLKNKR